MTEQRTADSTKALFKDAMEAWGTWRHACMACCSLIINVPHVGPTIAHWSQAAPMENSSGKEFSKLGGEWFCATSFRVT